MDDALVRLTHQPAGVTTLTLNRAAKRNALSREVLRELESALTAVKSTRDLRLLILAAEGPVFCAGMDLGEMQSRAGLSESDALWHEDARLFAGLLGDHVRLPCPTLAAVQGPALAGGLGLVLACDMVVASANAWFALPEPRRGIVAAAVMPLLIHRIGAGRAGHLLLSGRNLSAADAHTAGLCHEVAVPDQFDRRVSELSAAILTGGPTALAATKDFLLRTSAADLWSQLDAAVELSARARSTPEAREGLQAFLEKRPPAWSPDPAQPAESTGTAP